MNRRRIGALLLASGLVLAACGDDDGDDPTVGAGSDATTTTAAAGVTATTTAGGDPLVAGTEFFTVVLGLPNAPSLDGFQQGDANSGEIPVHQALEGGGEGPVRSTLLLRIVDGSWQVTGAISDGVVLDAPAAGATVAAGPVEVTGQGRGFEGTLIARAVPVAGGDSLDEQIITAGAAEALEPFTTTLDLSGAAPGDEVFLVVGNESAADGSIGEFAVIRVTVG